MRTLIMHESKPGTPFTEALRRSGHDIVECFGSGGGFPCDGAYGSCPLDGSVDVAVVVRDRPSEGVPLDQIGVVCAIRDGVPLVVAGDAALSAFGPSATAVAVSPIDLPGACDRAVAARVRRAGRAITESLGSEASVEIDGGAVRVHLDENATAHDTMRAHQRARAVFPAARSISVGPR